MYAPTKMRGPPPRRWSPCSHVQAIGFWMRETRLGHLAVTWPALLRAQLHKRSPQAESREEGRLAWTLPDTVVTNQHQLPRQGHTASHTPLLTRPRQGSPVHI